MALTALSVLQGAKPTSASPSGKSSGGKEPKRPPTARTLEIPQRERTEWRWLIQPTIIIDNEVEEMMLSDAYLTLHSIAFSGPLKKQGFWLRRRWTQRWVMLRGRILSYYSEQGCMKPKGTFEITDSTKLILDDTTLRFTLEPANPSSQVWRFEANSVEEYTSWTRTLYLLFRLLERLSSKKVCLPYQGSLEDHYVLSDKIESFPLGDLFVAKEREGTQPTLVRRVFLRSSSSQASPSGMSISSSRTSLKHSVSQSSDLDGSQRPMSSSHLSTTEGPTPSTEVDAYLSSQSGVADVNRLVKVLRSASRRVRCPYLTRCLGIFQDRGGSYIDFVFPYPSPSTLAQILPPAPSTEPGVDLAEEESRRQAWLEHEARVAAIIGKLAMALAFLHKMNIVHRAVSLDALLWELDVDDTLLLARSESRKDVSRLVITPTLAGLHGCDLGSTYKKSLRTYTASAPMSRALKRVPSPIADRPHAAVWTRGAAVRSTFASRTASAGSPSMTGVSRNDSLQHLRIQRRRQRLGSSSAPSLQRLAGEGIKSADSATSFSSLKSTEADYSVKPYDLHSMVQAVEDLLDVNEDFTIGEGESKGPETAKSNEVLEKWQDIMLGELYVHLGSKKRVEDQISSIKTMLLQEDGDECKSSDPAPDVEVAVSALDIKTQKARVHSIAPEVLATGDYESPADVWGLGIVMYALLMGSPPPPFEGSPADLLEQCSQGALAWNRAAWQWVSKDAKTLLASMLAPNPSMRLSAWDVLNLPWVSPHLEKKIVVPASCLDAI